MKIVFESLAGINAQDENDVAAQIKTLIADCIEQFSEEFVQDMSHISQAANYAGNIAVDEVIHLKDNLYRCDYSYDWAIAWTCSGTQEAGRVKEKVRFTLADNGELHFKFLKLEM